MAKLANFRRTSKQTQVDLPQVTTTPEVTKELEKLVYESLVDLEYAEPLKQLDGSMLQPINFEERLKFVQEAQEGLKMDMDKFTALSEAEATSDLDKKKAMQLVIQLTDMYQATEAKTVAEKKAMYKKYPTTPIFQMTHDNLTFECPIEEYKGRVVVALFYNGISQVPEALEELKNASTRAAKKKIIKKYTELTSITLADKMNPMEPGIYALINEL